MPASVAVGCEDTRPVLPISQGLKVRLVVIVIRDRSVHTVVTITKLPYDTSPAHFVTKNHMLSSAVVLREEIAASCPAPFAIVILSFQPEGKGKVCAAQVKVWRAQVCVVC